MAECKRLSDVLPPEDGWVAFIPNLPVMCQMTHEEAAEQRRRIQDTLDALPNVEFTLTGFWDDADG